MNCPNCGSYVPENSAFCTACGANMQAQPQPYAAPAQPQYYSQQAPEKHPAMPLIGMIFGIVSAVMGFVSYILAVTGMVSRRADDAAEVLVVLGAVLAVVALVFSIIGMVKSVRTGGKKYVAGIVFSAVGIATAAFALLFGFLTMVVGGIFGSIGRYYL